MREQDKLDFCLLEIEKKIDWGDSAFWKETEFKQLSELIFKKTKISVSPQTFKRLYGKIKYAEYYNPQRATKNALAKFLGFADWTDFTIHLHEKSGYETAKKKHTLSKKRVYKITLPFIIVGVFILLIVSWVIKNDFNHVDTSKAFSFQIRDSIGLVPFTVSTNYNINKLPGDSVLLDFDISHPVNGLEMKVLDKEKSLNNFTYQIPGYYQISLRSEGTKLASKNVLVMSQDWNSFYYTEAKPDIWLDNQFKSEDRDRDGYLYFSSDYLAKNGVDVNSVFFMNHQLYKKFDIDGDNFEMKARFRNSEETGGITCYDFLTNIVSEKNLSYLRLMEIGCSGYSGIKLGKTEVTGIDENLASLTFNKENWNDLHVIVKNNKVNVFLNEEKIYSGNYQGSNGKIVGLEFWFKGTGILDNIFLNDLGTNKRFFDDFE